MAFAYKDEYGILHVVGDQKTAKQFASSAVVETDIRNEGGYPRVSVGDHASALVVYGNGDAYVDGNERNGRKVSLSNFPEVEKVYEQLK
jgi:hypothetical protein